MPCNTASVDQYFLNSLTLASKSLQQILIYNFYIEVLCVRSLFVDFFSIPDFRVCDGSCSPSGPAREAAPLCRHCSPRNCKSDISLKIQPRNPVSYSTSSTPTPHMNIVSLRTLRPATRFIHTPTLTRTFKPHLLLYRPLPSHHGIATNNMETNNKDLELSNLFDVKGKVALITGGGQSIRQSTLPRDNTDMDQDPASV